MARQAVPDLILLGAEPGPDTAAALETLDRAPQLRNVARVTRDADSSVAASAVAVALLANASS